jgi:hypothetical protein
VRRQPLTRFQYQPTLHSCRRQVHQRPVDVRIFTLFITLFVSVLPSLIQRSSALSFLPGKPPPPSFGPLAVNACRRRVRKPVGCNRHQREVVSDCQAEPYNSIHILPSKEQVAKSIKVFVLLLLLLLSVL